jgi:hypothetical protein
MKNQTTTRSVWKVSNHFEYLKNRSCGLDAIWQPAETLLRTGEQSLSHGAS